MSLVLTPHAVNTLLPRSLSESGRAYGRWVRELDTEVAFWRRWFADPPAGSVDERRERFDPATPLQAWVRDLVNTPAGGTVHLLDVGAGPATWLGKVWPGRTVEITAIDPLAAHYCRVLRKHGLRAPVPTQPGQGERLGELVAPDSFDLAYAINALDHSYDPLSVIQGMLWATKPGGWVALDHHMDEAEQEHYEGLHQWNFRDENGTFVIWNRERRIVVNDLLPSAEILTSVARGTAPGQKDWLFVRIRKARIPAPPDTVPSAGEYAS